MTKRADAHDEERRSTAGSANFAADSKPSGCSGSCAGCAGCGDSLYPPYNPFEHMEEEEKRRRKREKHNRHTEHAGDCRDEHSGDCCGREHEGGCGCGHDHEHGDESGWKPMLVRLILAVVLLVCAKFIAMPFGVSLSLFLLSYLIAGGDVLWRALKGIFKGHLFDENFLMAIATVGAFVIGDYAEGIAVMLFYQFGEMLQDIAVSRSRRSITALMDIRPDFARKRSGGQLVTCKPEEVALDDVIVVNPGERIPLDGIVVSGRSFLDTSALTGESVPRAAAEGDEVLSGAINQNATLEIQVTKRFHESTVSKILELTQNASSRKANTEKFITKFARVYTPIVVGTAALVAVLPPLFLGWNTFSDWLYRALIFLVISCPCALVVSIPLGFFGGIGGASKRGILVKGSNYLEALHSVDTVVLDKTGTLTRGKFSVQALSPAAGVSETDLLEAAAFAESRSSHPIAKSILDRYGQPVEDSRIAESRENAGFGTEVTLADGTVLLAGSAKLMQRHGIVAEQPSLSAGTLVYVAKNGMFLGSLLIADTLKPTSAEAVRALKAAGVKEVVMLTGDSPAAAAAIAEEAGITSWRAELLPQDKVAAVDSMLEGRDPKHKLAFVGDGINDAPVIARADVGVAMGGIGSDAAIEAADVVLMTDDLAKLPLAIRIARKTKRIVTQNIVFALGVKIIVLALSIVGITSMWIAIFADVGVALIAILNALRAMRVKETPKQRKNA
ncbi:MAG: heavy metal translocating P-type ATPase [Oscillospiraceae bacterium]|jgi:Cd2+/Zn2+-exporting ATPase